MTFDPVLAETRFGYGLSPDIAPPSGVEDMLAGLTARDAMAQRFPIAPFPILFQQIGIRRRLKAEMEGADPVEARALKRAIKAINREARDRHTRALGAQLQRRTRSATAFRERLESFWANHFTAIGKSVPIRYGAPGYVESAIRPHVAARFSDLLIAAVIHPLMLHYLDQKRSVGPGSIIGRATGRGLNENLAREVLELHTLGAGGPYGQSDVRALAELLTGLSSGPQSGTVFRQDQAQPGPKTVLGKTYGSGMSEIHTALEDIALQPATAHHICSKLAAHFVSDAPPERLCAAMCEAYIGSKGALVEVYRAMVSDAAAWRGDAEKLRPPFAFMASVCRAMGTADAAITAMGAEEILQCFAEPLVQMGEDWLRPKGPNGFPDASEAWLTPQGMAARASWALTVPQRLSSALPDPRSLLAARAAPSVHTAICDAESREQGLALYFLSPSFQRV